jgi:hypothetical protein
VHEVPPQNPYITTHMPFETLQRQLAKLAPRLNVFFKEDANQYLLS